MHLFIGGSEQGGLALLQERGVQIVGAGTAGASAEGVIADGGAVPFPKPDPALVQNSVTGRIEFADELALVCVIARGEEKLRCGPDDLVIVHELVAVMTDFLIGTVAAIPGECGLQ